MKHARAPRPQRQERQASPDPRSPGARYASLPAHPLRRPPRTPPARHPPRGRVTLRPPGTPTLGPSAGPPTLDRPRRHRPHTDPGGTVLAPHRQCPLASPRHPLARRRRCPLAPARRRLPSRPSADGCPLAPAQTAPPTGPADVVLTPRRQRPVHVSRRRRPHIARPALSGWREQLPPAVQTVRPLAPPDSHRPNAPAAALPPIPPRQSARRRRLRAGTSLPPNWPRTRGTRHAPRHTQIANRHYESVPLALRSQCASDRPRHLRASVARCVSRETSPSPCGWAVRLEAA
ncbi:Basic proline-rich protein precursor [[Actinomadura] parvosata subsp. kistnae]|nr:Basic proline-rich protein precursor [Actinomadura parvosata subsp. kistnae]